MTFWYKTAFADRSVELVTSSLHTHNFSFTCRPSRHLEPQKRIVLLEIIVAHPKANRFFAVCLRFPAKTPERKIENDDSASTIQLPQIAERGVGENPMIATIASAEQFSFRKLNGGPSHGYRGTLKPQAAQQADTSKTGFRKHGQLFKRAVSERARQRRVRNDCDICDR